MANYTINRGDREPPLKATLQQLNETTGKYEPINLTSATSVTFVMMSVEPEGTTISGACTVAEAANGVVEYPWAATDTQTAGKYRAQWEILWSNGKPQTVPSRGYMTVEVQEDLKGDA